MTHVVFSILFAFIILVVLCWSVSPPKDNASEIEKLKLKVKKAKIKYDEFAKQLTELSDTSLSDNVDAKEQQKDIIILKTIAEAQQQELDESNIETRIEQRAMQLFNDSFPEYKKYYEQYKILCDNERLAFRNIAENLEPALRAKTLKLIDGIKLGKLHKSFDVDRDFLLKNINISAKIYSRNTATKEENSYTVTLTTCTCDDIKYNKVPACKHMLFLARTLGVLQVYRELHHEEFTEIRDEAEKYVIQKAKKGQKKRDKDNESPPKRKRNQNSASPSLSDKTKKSTSYIRGSEEDM